MLAELRIRNLAVIEDLEIGFEPGFNVITGETGAGKTILMRALGLLLGDRGGSDLIRDGASEAEVEALFAGRGGRARRCARVQARMKPDGGEPDAGLPADAFGEPAEADGSARAVRGPAARVFERSYRHRRAAWPNSEQPSCTCTASTSTTRCCAPRPRG